MSGEIGMGRNEGNQNSSSPSTAGHYIMPSHLTFRKDSSALSDVANGSPLVDELPFEATSKEAYFSRVETFTISFSGLVLSRADGDGPVCRP
uniref:Uncharacterized protein n=1 Tax=Varanus komodoensis TaxID=61221 RepID=A0A8D2IQC4_VARKO